MGIEQATWGNPTAAASWSCRCLRMGQTFFRWVYTLAILSSCSSFIQVLLESETLKNLTMSVIPPSRLSVAYLHMQLRQIKRREQAVIAALIYWGFDSQKRHSSCTVKVPSLRKLCTEAYTPYDFCAEAAETARLLHSSNCMILCMDLP